MLLELLLVLDTQPLLEVIQLQLLEVILTSQSQNLIPLDPQLYILPT